MDGWIHPCLKPPVFQLLRTRMANVDVSTVGSSPESHTIQKQKQTLKVLHCTYCIFAIAGFFFFSKLI